MASEITFHCFPKNEKRFHQWLHAIGQWDENITWSKNMVICSEHFKENDIMKTAKLTIIKEGDIPYIKGSSVEKSLPSNIIAPVPSTSTVLPDLQVTESLQEMGRSASPQIFVTPSATTSSLKRKKQTEGNGSESLYFTLEQSPQNKQSPSKLSETGSVSSGSDSSLDRRRKILKAEHSYCVSPRTAKRKSEKLKTEYIEARKKAYRAKQSIRILKRRVKSLRDVVKHLTAKKVLSTNALEHLQTTAGNVPNSLFSRIKEFINGSKTVPRKKYPEELRKLAIALHFYSSKAYDYVRRVFNLALPHPSVITKWSSTIECTPGFSAECLTAIKTKVEEAAQNHRKIICSLLLDEMSIKKQIDFDGKRYWGYVEIGVDNDNDEIQPASEALVIMVVCHNASWKIPIAYFLIQSMSGAEKANLINEALIIPHEIGVEVTSVTCDGPSAHFAMFRQLGCNFSTKNLINCFVHPCVKEKKVYAIFDACHMLKLIRNCLGTLGVLIDPSGNEIKWEFITKLFKIQEQETLSLANKLGKSHVQWQKQKMKVNLAAQTLSNSIAEALSFLCDDLKHPDFQGCQATVNFIKRIDSIFDILNLRIPQAKNMKAPLRIVNESMWRPFVNDSIEYLLKIKDVKGQFLWPTPRKTLILGFTVTLKSVSDIYDDFVKSGKLNYLLTYKCSQDHLELFFCAVRSRNGWNNNPTALQFMRSYRKLILHADVSSSTGNCRVMDTTTVLTVSSGTRKVPIIKTIDISDVRKNNLNYDIFTQDHDYDITPYYISLNEYSQDVVTYMSGYVITMLKKLIFCEECLELIVQQQPTDKNYMLMRRRNLGPYLFPSKGLVTICRETEIFIRKLMYLTENSLPSPDLVTDIIAVSRKLFGSIEKLYKGHPEHSFNLLKLTINCYCKIRLNNLAKQFTNKIQGELVRKQLNRLIILRHQ